MTGYRVVLVLFLSASLSSCAQRSFDRFIDNPITSWLPVDEYANELSGTSTVPPMSPSQNKQCYETAKERTEFSGIQGDVTATEFQNLFRAEYTACLRASSN
jgi:hypothetical protein